MEKNQLFNHSLKWGLIIGIINIIISLLVYIVDETFLVKWWFGIMILLINVVLIIIAGIQYRSSIGGNMNFKTAFSVIFLTLIIAGILGTFFNIVLYKVIDPDLTSRLELAIIEQSEQMMSRMGAPQDTIDEQLDTIEENAASQFTVTGMIKTFGFSLIFYLIVSLIIGAIIKKKENTGEMR